MKLKFNKQVTGSVVTVTFNVSNFSIDEKKAIRVLGSPDVVYENAFEVSGCTITIDTKLSDFNTLGSFVFKGDIDTISDVLEEVQEFIVDMKDVLTEVMQELMFSYQQVSDETNTTGGEFEIKDGYCHKQDQAQCNC